MIKIVPINKAQRSITLNIVRAHQPVSRGRIRELTGIRLATVGAVVNRLKKDGLLTERRPSQKGVKWRRTGLLEINPDGRFAIGVACFAGRISAVTLNLAGKVIQERSLPFDPATRRAGLILKIKAVVRELIQAAPPRTVAGIGFVDPGTIDIEKGLSILSTILPQWKNVPIKSILATEFGLPVYLSNGQCALALAEHHFGLGRGRRDFLVISYGAGISCGIFSGGRVIWGGRNIAGELGRTRVHGLGRDGANDGAGFLENQASLSALRAKLRGIMRPADYARLERDFTLISDYDRLAGAKKIRRALDEAFEPLSLAVANLVNVLNPELVILDANFKTLGARLLGELTASIKEKILPENRTGLSIKISELPPPISPLGGGAMVIDHLFSA